MCPQVFKCTGDLTKAGLRRVVLAVVWSGLGQGETGAKRTHAQNKEGQHGQCN